MTHDGSPHSIRHSVGGLPCVTKHRASMSAPIGLVAPAVLALALSVVLVVCIILS